MFRLAVKYTPAVPEFLRGKHWLKGEKVLEFDRSSDTWKKMRETGKWKDFPDYAKTESGLIALQINKNVSFNIGR